MLQAVLVADVARGRERFRVVGIDDDLHDAFVVAKVDEDHAAMVAARIDPPAKRDGLAEQGLVDETAVVGAHEIVAIAPGGAGRREMLRRRLLPRNMDRVVRAGAPRNVDSA